MKKKSGILNQFFYEIQLLAKECSSFILLQNNLCYVWGRNDFFQLGLGDTNTRFIPTLFSLPNNERISFITCGEKHTICLTENNLCYVWGYSNNFYCQLGFADSISVSTPTLLTLPNNEKISFITCGAYHTTCLTENDLCYVWGNNIYGQLGLGDTTNRPIPTLFSLPNNEKISFITCGSYHTTCLNENNLCYVWGSNKYGQLGLGYQDCFSSPTLLSLSNNEKISFITCGACHTICLTENNLCYVWGRNNYGQLGLGDEIDRIIPHLLSFPNNEIPTYVACGAYHTMCITQNHLCYGWGYNIYGELGLGITNTQYIPTLLTLPNNEKISFIVCGNYHTICLTENNLCYVWGYNTYGQLGLGDYKDRYSPTLLQLFEQDSSKCILQ